MGKKKTKDTVDILGTPLVKKQQQPHDESEDTEWDIMSRIEEVVRHLALEGPCEIGFLCETYGVPFEIILHYLDHLLVYPNWHKLDEPMICSLKEQHKMEIILKYA